EHDRVVEGNVARELYRAGGQEFATLAVVHAEGDAVAQLEFAHAPGRGQRQDVLLAGLLQEFEHRLGVFRVVDHLGVGARLDVALQVQRDAGDGGGRHVQRVERQLRRAAQLEAAGGEQQGKGKSENSSHQTTILIRRPGTMIMRRIACSPMYFFISSLARTSSSRPFWSSVLGAFSVPFFLPLICTTYSISSCSSAAGSGSGQGARSTSSPKPSSRHSAWQTCGVMGESSR